MTPTENQGPVEASGADGYEGTEAQVRLYEWPMTMRILFLLTSAGMPVLLFLVITGDTMRVLGPWFLSLWFAVVTTVLTTLIFSFGIRRSTSVPRLYAASFALTLLAAVDLRFGLAEPWMAPSLLLFLTIGILFRFGPMTSKTYSAGEHRRAFVSDTAVIAAVGVYSLVGAPAVGTSPTVIGVTALTACGTVLLRLYFLWTIERQTSGAPLSARSSWLVIAILTLLAAIFGPTILFHTVMGIFGVTGLLFIPVVLLLDKLHLHPNFFAQLAAATRPGVRKQPEHTLPPAPAPGWVHLLPIITIAIVLLVLLYVLFRPRKYINPMLPEAESDVDIVERKPVSRKQGLNFVQTTDPVRLRIQQWLGERKKAGDEMLHHETVRQFARRLDSAPYATLVQTYEKVRYDDEI
ncbi:MAG: hypothetical protein A2201_02675 [Alicyclobacillus sp. RIFOXYA1_FULL_53_8]|nr:MAG: hypothetical protein A2201_02675 [Alicyclobacillus sp. RIFOXYA1_FULL_53_8]